jgi:hypothetical protein
MPGTVGAVPGPAEGRTRVPGMTSFESDSDFDAYKKTAPSFRRKKANDPLRLDAARDTVCLIDLRVSDRCEGRFRESSVDASLLTMFFSRKSSRSNYAIRRDELAVKINFITESLFSAITSALRMPP